MATDYHNSLPPLESTHAPLTICSEHIFSGQNPRLKKLLKQKPRPLAVAMLVLAAIISACTCILLPPRIAQNGPEAPK